MKTIAKTTTPIMLIDPQTRDVLQERPSVVTWTQFLEARTGKGQIKVLAADLPAEATDADFQKYLDEAENEELAVASFVSQYEPEKQNTTRKRKTAETQE